MGKTKKRTQDEVDALWPEGKPEYTITGHVTSKAETMRQIVAELQKLYETEGGVAGRFKVLKSVMRKGDRFKTLKPVMRKGDNTVWEVKFTRDVADDFEVLQPVLRAGRDFSKALTDQFQREVADAIKVTKADVRLEVVGSPVFGEYIEE